VDGPGDTLPPTFTTRTARDLGVHPRELYAWRDAGEIIELSRGVFRRADAPPASYPDLLAVAYRAPRGIVCCVSAAVVYDLTDELPRSVQVAVPKNSHPPEISYPPATVFRFDTATFELGLSAFDAAPQESVRVYNAARTVTDLMRLRHRLGEPIAHTALNRYLGQPGSRPALLLTYAQALGVLGPVRSALDIASAR
jgi:predicted transcriptional regulator of viral defense system